MAVLAMEYGPNLQSGDGSGTIDFGDKLYIDQTNSRVGILTSAPAQTLDVRGIITAGTPIALATTVCQLRAFDASNAGFTARTTNVEARLSAASSAAFLATDTAHPISVYTNGNHCATFTTGTRILFGHTADITGGAITDGIQVAKNGSVAFVVVGRNVAHATSAIGSVAFYNGSTQAATMQAEGAGATDSAQMGFFTKPTGGSLTERVRLSSAGDVYIGLAALATTATTGFLMIPASAGAPTGAVSPPPGMVALHYDSTNHHIYVRSGGTWRMVAVA